MTFGTPDQLKRFINAALLICISFVTSYASVAQADVLKGMNSSALFVAGGTAASLELPSLLSQTTDSTGAVTTVETPNAFAVDPRPAYNSANWRVEVWAFGGPFGGSPTFNGNPQTGKMLIRWEPVKGGIKTPAMPLPSLSDGVYAVAILGLSQTGPLLSSTSPICRKDTMLNDMVSDDTRYCNFNLSQFDNFIGYMRCTNGNCFTFNNIVPETGGWWNPDESGRGFFIEASHGTLVGRFMMYDTNGNAVWYLTAGSLTSDGSFTGKLLQYAGGQSLTGDYVAPKVVNDAVGTVSIKFSDSSTGVLTLPNGRQINIQRFKF